jgi:Mrp family chromosome partitioning ATPase
MASPHYPMLPTRPQQSLGAQRRRPPVVRFGSPHITSEPHWARRSPLPTGPTARFLELDNTAQQAYSQLLERVSHAIDLSQPRAICFTSALAGAGKTSLVIDLALVAAMNPHRRVLVIDANLTNPRAAERLGFHPNVGLGEVLAEGVHPTEAICTVTPAGYDILPAGAASPRALGLLGSRRMNVLLWDLKQSYDFIVIDSPHVAKHSIDQFRAGFDAIYIVVQMLWTRRRAIDRAIALLQHEGIAIGGCVLTYSGSVPQSPNESNYGVAENACDDSNAGAPGWPILEPNSIPADTVTNNAQESESYEQTTSGYEAASPVTSTTDTSPVTPGQSAVETSSPSNMMLTWPDYPDTSDMTSNELCGSDDSGLIGATTELAAHGNATSQPVCCGDDAGMWIGAMESREAIDSGAAPDIQDAASALAIDDNFPSLTIDSPAHAEDQSATMQPELELAAESVAELSAYIADSPPVCDATESSGLALPDLILAPADASSSFDESAAETLRRLETVRPFDSDFESVIQHEESVTCDGRRIRSFRIPRLAGGLLQSNVRSAEAIDARDVSRDPWAADILALSGLMLIAASILYVAADALLWF